VVVRSVLEKNPLLSIFWRPGPDQYISSADSGPDPGKSNQCVLDPETLVVIMDEKTIGTLIGRYYICDEAWYLPGSSSIFIEHLSWCTR
jgi:hypothetical protein